MNEIKKIYKVFYIILLLFLLNLFNIYSLKKLGSDDDVLWKLSLSINYKSNFIIKDDKIYFINNENNKDYELKLYIIDLIKGNIIEEKPLNKVIEKIYAEVFNLKSMKEIKEVEGPALNYFVSNDNKIFIMTYEVGKKSDKTWLYIFDIDSMDINYKNKLYINFNNLDNNNNLIYHFSTNEYIYWMITDKNDTFKYENKITINFKLFPDYVDNFFSNIKSKLFFKDNKVYIFNQSYTNNIPEQFIEEYKYNGNLNTKIKIKNSFNNLFNYNNKWKIISIPKGILLDSKNNYYLNDILFSYNNPLRINKLRFRKFNSSLELIGEKIFLGDNKMHAYDDVYNKFQVDKMGNIIFLDFFNKQIVKIKI